MVVPFARVTREFPYTEAMINIVEVVVVLVEVEVVLDVLVVDIEVDVELEEDELVDVELELVDDEDDEVVDVVEPPLTITRVFEEVWTSGVVAESDTSRQ